MVRFRLLNAANARTFHVALSDNRPFQQIAGDGGLLTNKVTRSSLRIAPGERAEIVVRFNPGESVNLVSLGREVTPTSFPGAMPRLLRQLNSEAFNLLALHCESSLEERSALPGETVRLIMRFTDYTDENNPYMYHCHILEHEDLGMMGQFVLV